MVNNIDSRLAQVRSIMKHSNDRGTRFSHRGLSKEFGYKQLLRARREAMNYRADKSNSYVKSGDHLSVRDYLDERFQRINLYLRNGLQVVSNRERGVNTAMQELMKNLGEPQTLYRGMKVPFLNDDGDPPKVGDEVTLKSYMSASRDPFVICDCMYDCDDDNISGSVLEILTTNKTMGMSLDNADTGREDYETILNFGQRLKIRDIYDKVQVNPSDARTINKYYVASCMD